MRARHYTKRIDFYQVTSVPDGYGGNTITEDLITSSWCNISTPKNTQRLVDVGVTDILNTIVITLRKRNDINYNAINQFIKYNGFKYVIQGVIDKDLRGIEIEITATREQTDSVTEIEPIDG
ncbi:MAG: phage head closure protein [Gelidibacter sp.]|nr:phage head closure protein [Gelidibacter sp.]